MSTLRRTNRRRARGRTATGITLRAVALSCSIRDSATPAESSAQLTTASGSIVPSTPAPGDPFTPGVLPGGLTVDDDGAARSSIPLWIPAGRMGVRPNLSIDYSSRARNGVMGVGWTLTGLSSIGPCMSSPIYDGKKRAVRLDGQDPYCMDGAHLRKLGAFSTRICFNGQEYRTIPDNGSRILSCLSSGNAAPTYWVV